MKNKKKKKGSTLLEIVIALAIIGIMMLPLANSLLTSVKANKMGEETQEAKLLGQQVVEGLKGEEAIKPGNINISGYEFEVTESIPGDKSKLNIKSVNDINDYEVVGTLELNNITQINGDKHLDVSDSKNKLGGLIVIKNNKLEIIQGIDAATSIESLLNTSGLTKYNMETIPDEEVTVSMVGEDIIIKDQHSEMYTINNNNDYVLGVYVKESTGMKNLTIENLNTVKENVYIFRDSQLSKEEGTLEGKLTYKGEIYRASNIIYDEEKNIKALYSLDLNIKKDNETIESTNAQFYVGK